MKMRYMTYYVVQPWKRVSRGHKRVLIFLICALAFYVALAIGHANTGRSATFADRPNATLDNIASEIAGHPVHVWCEGNPADWQTSAMGWTLPPQYGHTVYVMPAVCDYLQRLLDSSTDRSLMALNWIAISVHTLVHESVHQIGGEYADCYAAGPTDQGCEARTDCKALSLDEGVLVKWFGYGPTLAHGWKMVAKVVRRHGHKVRVMKRVNFTVMLEHPDLAQILSYTVMLHEGLPPAYQGVC
jgi:hypothetical protein